MITCVQETAMRKTRFAEPGRPEARVGPARLAFLLLALSPLSPRAAAQAPPRPAAPAAASAGAAAPAASSRVAPADRLPGGCNAVMVVDVARLVDSPWGKQNEM